MLLWNWQFVVLKGKDVTIYRLANIENRFIACLTL